MMRPLALLWIVVAAAACRRENRPLHVDPPGATRRQDVRVSTLQPGPTPIDSAARPDSIMPPPESVPHEDIAYNLNTGKQLYFQFNCAGCHSQGGGGMGPPLMDSVWIYGSQPRQVFATIVQGRPNGMPAFGRRIPTYQVWQLVGYVRSMSGLVPFTSAPGRGDHLFPRQPENSPSLRDRPRTEHQPPRP